MGRANANQILNITMYQVEFAGGEATELTTNTIAASMYAKCDANGIEYLLINWLVNYVKDKRAMFLTDQQIII